MLHAQNLSVKFKNVSFSFPEIKLEPGNSCIIQGDSGTGKTTFLHALACLLETEKGKYSVNQTELTTLPVKEREKWRSSEVGMVLQQSIFPKNLTFKEHFKLILKWKGQEQIAINEWAEKLGVSHRINAFPFELSGGERARMAMLQALIAQPKVLIVDEVTSNLDATSTEELMDLIMKNKPKSGYLIFASHDQRIVDYFEQNVFL